MDAAADRFRRGRSALSLLFDDPLEQAFDKGDAGRLDRLQITRRQHVGGAGVAGGVPRIGQDRVNLADRRAGRPANQADRVFGVDDIGNGRCHPAKVDHLAFAQGHDARSARLARQPGPPDQDRPSMVGRQNCVGA